MGAVCLLGGCGAEKIDLQGGEMTESFKSDYLEIEPYPCEEEKTEYLPQIAEYIKTEETGFATDYKLKETISSYFYALQTGNEELYKYVLYPEYEQILEMQSEYKGTPIAAVINKERSLYGTNFKIMKCMTETIKEENEYLEGYTEALKDMAVNFGAETDSLTETSGIYKVRCTLITAGGENYYTELIAVQEDERYYAIPAEP